MQCFIQPPDHWRENRLLGDARGGRDAVAVERAGESPADYGVWGSVVSSPVGSGTEPRPKTILVVFKPVQNASHCTLLLISIPSAEVCWCKIVVHYSQHPLVCRHHPSALCLMVMSCGSLEGGDERPIAYTTDWQFVGYKKLADCGKFHNHY